MYAKLVVGGTAISAVAAIRDIGRLLVATSGNVTTSLLSTFSTSSSVILDATPAGWTYVGSTNSQDRPTIGVVGTTYTQTASSPNNLCFSAPCLEGDTLKYIALTVGYTTSTTDNYIALTGAVSATSLGVLTNEGPRSFSGGVTNSTTANLISMAAGTILHVIATQRGCTIIIENAGLVAVWESTMSDVNRFYNTAPFIQYAHPVSSYVNFNLNVAPASNLSSTNAFATAFAVTDVNTGTYYGTYDISNTSSTTPKSNIYFLCQNDITSRKNSIDSVGNPRYQITPVLYSNYLLGHPIQYVTGVVSIYWTKPSLGNTGDTVMIGTEPYTYFNCGTGFSVIMKTV